MKYYKFEYNSLNEKETGTQFQCVTTKSIGDVQNGTLPYEGKIYFDFNLPEPVLENKAIPTSLLNVVPIPNWFLILDDRFLNFFKAFSNEKLQSWKIKVYHKNLILDNYNLVYLYETMQNVILSFEDSIFYVGNIFDSNFHGDIIKIEDYEDYINKRKLIEHSESEYILKHSKISFDFSKQNNDFIRLINCPYGGYYVSEKLKNKIEKQRFTGLKFVAIEEMDSRIQVKY